MIKQGVFGIDVKSLKYPQQFNSPSNIQHDYALLFLFLSESIRRRQYFPLGVAYQFMRETITNIAYRQNDAKYEKQFGTQKMEQSHGEHSRSRKSFTLLHKITTTNGNSRGPLFVGREGGPIAIAIHKGKKKNMNGARLISEDLLGRVLKWEKQFYMGEFRSRINAFKMEASPSLGRIDYEAVMKRMEGVNVIEALRQTQRGLKEAERGLRVQIETYKRQSDSLRRSIDELVKGFEEARREKEELEFELRIEQLNYNNTADEIQRLELQIQTARNKRAAQQIQKASLLADTKSLGIKWESRTELTLASLRRTVATPPRIPDRQPEPPSVSASPSKQGQSLHQLSAIKFWDTVLPQSCRFTVLDRKAVLKNNDSQRYQISSLHKLQGYSTTPFKLRCYGHERPICVGVLARERKMYRFTGGRGTAGTVAYWTGKGKVQIEGEERDWQDEMFLPQGGILLMEVDQYDMKITFTLQQLRRKFQFPLPASFKEKELYPFVCMACKGDAVQILL